MKQDPASVRGADLLALGARAHPRARVAQFTTSSDLVQIGFYGVMKANYGPGGSCPDPGIDWYQQMTGKLQSYADAVPNYRYYLAGGQYHTALRSPAFYGEASTGTALSQWTTDMLARRSDDDEGANAPNLARWTNQACPGCMVNLVCP